MRSLSCRASTAGTVPCMPGMPRWCGCESGNAPRAISVVTTGRPVRSASFEQLFVRLGADDTATHVEHGTLRLEHQLGRGGDLLAVRLRDRAVAGQVELRRPRERHRTLLRVFRDVDEHGAWATRRGDVVRRGQRRGHVFGALHEDRVLRDRHRDPHDVDLLEGIRSHRGREHLAGDREQRHRVHVGVGDRGDEVGGTRTGGRDRDADATRGGGVALGGVAGALLVAHQDVPDGGGCHQLVVERHDGAARQSEDVGDAELFERGEDRARSGHAVRVGLGGAGGAAGAASAVMGCP